MWLYMDIEYIGVLTGCEHMATKGLVVLYWYTCFRIAFPPE